MDADSFAPGEAVFALNPKYSDGTRLRAEPRAEAEFNGVWVPNDSPLEVIQRRDDFYEVRKPDGQKGWIRARNLARTARVAGFSKAAASTQGLSAPGPLPIEALPAVLRDHPRYRIVRLIGH